MNIYDMLNKIILNDKSDLCPSLFSDKSRQGLDSTADKEIFDLMKDISSLALKDGAFHPAIIWDGKRSFSVVNGRYVYSAFVHKPSAKSDALG